MSSLWSVVISMFSIIVTRISLDIYMQRHYHATLLGSNRVEFTSLDDQKTAQLSLLKKSTHQRNSITCFAPSSLFCAKDRPSCSWSTQHLPSQPRSLEGSIWIWYSKANQKKKKGSAPSSWSFKYPFEAQIRSPKRWHSICAIRPINLKMRTPVIMIISKIY